MEKQPPLIEYADAEGDRPVPVRRALLSCLPGSLTLFLYAAHQYVELPAIFAQLFWPLMAIAVAVGFVSFARFRRAYRGRSRPLYISLTIAAHTVTLLLGVPLLSLLILSRLFRVQ